MTATTTAPDRAADRAATSRANGRKSRGPTSPEGRARSSMNALKHGLTSRRPVLPSESEDDYRDLCDGLFDTIRPRNAVEAALTQQAVSALWKIARADRAEAAAFAAAVRAAEAAAGARHQGEVGAMGHWMLTCDLFNRISSARSLAAFLPEEHHEPFRKGRGEPSYIIARLEATAEGCRWLLRRWAGLRRLLEEGEDWRTNEFIIALQLRGQRPLKADIQEWQAAVEPLEPKVTPEVVAQVRRGLRRQFDEGLPDEPEALRSALLVRVAEETARLEEREAGHRRREAADLAELADCLALGEGAAGDRARRYQIEFDRKLHRALAMLLKLRRAEAVGVGIAGDPAPDDTLSPEPEPEPTATVRSESGPLDGPEVRVDAAVEPEDRTAPRNEPGPPADGAGSRRNEPRPSAAFDGIPRNEPRRPAGGDRILRNELSCPPGAPDPMKMEPDREHDGLERTQFSEEPSTPSWIAAPAVPALILALMISLVSQLCASVAGPVARRADLPHQDGAGPSVHRPSAATAGSPSETPIGAKVVRRDELRAGPPSAAPAGLAPVPETN